ncbi:hypothetical protein EVA_14722 [gut metagenome]|uniref:Uncharacterized protein n=1 Tax=gut metagenome TaxID=749906 RepID=J9CB84_9ZZZZ
MMVAQRWTGWYRSRKEVLPLLPLLQPATGRTTASTSSILLDTLTLQ